MRLHRKIAPVLFAVLAAGSLLCAQTLPATQPTTPVVSNPGGLPLPVAPVSRPHPEAARRPRVEYKSGLMQVTADNASLNQILHEISRITGMKITGGVQDERVFGTYGPAEASTVLMQLLNGTGSNMLIVESIQDRPQELILTPRQGGPTPPNPNAGARDDDSADDDDTPPQLARHPQRPQPVAEPVQAAQPVPVAPARPAASSPDAASTTTEQSPNGVKTPQQIYDQLMQMQQQREKAKTPQN